MNRIIMIIIAAVVMSANCYGKKSARITYDERPENKQPVLERPAWPNYDLHDDRSFAAFSHVQTALEKPVRYIMTEGGSNFLPLTVYRCEDATYVCVDYQMPTSQDWLLFRFTTGSAIIDAVLLGVWAGRRDSALCDGVSSAAAIGETHPVI